jgi:hypothetical protein
MKRLAIAIALFAACKKQEPSSTHEAPAAMPAAEQQRSEEACKQYLERVCACAAKVPAAAKQCELARALPEAVRIGLEVAQSPDSKPDIVLKSYASVRKTAKECIEQTAKLPALGCP